MACLQTPRHYTGPHAALSVSRQPAHQFVAMNATGTLFATFRACSNQTVRQLEYLANSGLPVAADAGDCAADRWRPTRSTPVVSTAGIYRVVTGGTSLWTAVSRAASRQPARHGTGDQTGCSCHALCGDDGRRRVRQHKTAAQAGLPAPHCWQRCQYAVANIDVLGTLVAGTESGVALSGDGCANWSSITAGWTGSGPQATGQGHSNSPQ